jgi:hypothetical protein
MFTGRRVCDRALPMKKRAWAAKFEKSRSRPAPTSGRKGAALHARRELKWPLTPRARRWRCSAEPIRRNLVARRPRPNLAPAPVDLREGCFQQGNAGLVRHVEGFQPGELQRRSFLPAHAPWVRHQPHVTMFVVAPGFPMRSEGGEFTSNFNRPLSHSELYGALPAREIAFRLRGQRRSGRCAIVLLRFADRPFEPRLQLVRRPSAKTMTDFPGVLAIILRWFIRSLARRVNERNGNKRSRGGIDELAPAENTRCGQYYGGVAFHGGWDSSVGGWNVRPSFPQALSPRSIYAR